MRNLYGTVLLLFIALIIMSHAGAVMPDSVTDITTVEDCMYVSDIPTFATALVWTTNTASQTVAVVLDNFDYDSNLEVVAATSMSQLLHYSETGQLIWGYGLGAVPVALAGLSADSTGPREICVATSSGIAVIGANRSLLTSIPIFGGVSSLAVANIDADVLDEIVVGSDLGVIYAFKANGIQSWNVSTSGRILRVVTGNFDVDSQAEILVSSSTGKLLLLDNNGTVLFEKSLSSGTSAIASGDLLGTPAQEAIYVDGDRTVRVAHSNGTVAYSLTLSDRVTALVAVDVVAGGKNELVVGTSAGLVGVYAGTGSSLWSSNATASVLRFDVADIGNMGSDQVLVSTQDRITVLNSTGGFVSELTIQGFQGVLSTGNIDSVLGSEIA
ncbi:MAG: PQQ-binding-like beta-propeller repeat protein, partial [Candidatus Thorarchaeota archaeon]